MTLWTRELLTLMIATFVLRFGEGIFGGARTNYLVDVLGLDGQRVLWLEGLREIPGLALLVVAAFTMRLPLSYRAAVATLVLGMGYALEAFAPSYGTLVGLAILASVGMHMYMPLESSLGLAVSPAGRSGAVLGTLSAVTALASLLGMAAMSLASRWVHALPLNGYLLIGGVLISLSAVLLLRLPRTLGSTALPPPRMLIHRRYWLYYVLTFFEGSRKQVLGTFGSLVLVEMYRFEAWQISALLLASGAVNFFGAPVLGRLLDRAGERAVLTTSYVLLSLCCLGYALSHQVWLLCVLMVLIKLLVVLGMGLSTYVHRIAPPEELTPTLSAGISINHISSVAMPLLAGVLLPIVSYRGIFVGTAALIGLSVPFALMLPAARSQLARVAAAAAE
ncbi:MAG: MFS transporter [Chloroflexi bacterium]|nr:MFS transporter [Chloroflexota bacterium]